MLIATLSYGELKIIQLQLDEWAAKSNVTRKVLLTL